MGLRPKHRPRALTLAALALIAGPLVAPLSRQVIRAADLLPPAIEALAGTDFALRQVWYYGDCERLGFGYVKRIMNGYPDPEGMPLVRDPDEADNVLRALLPDFHPNRDDRVLIGVGIAESDTQEIRIARARREVDDLHGGGITSTWQFETGQGVELMTGVVLKFGAYPTPGPMKLELILIRTPWVRSEVIGRWKLETSGRQSGDLIFPLPVPISRFSLGRAATPFVLRVEDETGSPRGPSLVGVDVLGAKVSTKGYVVVNREGKCFTAVRSDVLAAMARAPQHPWLPWLEKIRNVRLD